jgi:hypothetical protein
VTCFLLNTHRCTDTIKPLNFLLMKITLFCSSRVFFHRSSYFSLQCVFPFSLLFFPLIPISHTSHTLTFLLIIDPIVKILGNILLSVNRSFRLKITHPHPKSPSLTQTIHKICCSLLFFSRWWCFFITWKWLKTRWNW